MSNAGSRYLRGPGAIVVLGLLALLVLYSPVARAHRDVEGLRVISSRADVVSGGDVLVRFQPSQGPMWTARLNGRDVSTAFRHPAGSDDLVALLSGLAVGTNTLEIRVGTAIRSRLQILNHPLSGPVFSGSHQSPFICQTEFNGLGPESDRDCNAKSIVQYYYKAAASESELSVDPHVEFFDRFVQAFQILGGRRAATLPQGFRPYDPANPMLKVDTIRLPDGRTVPYIVRREVGVINRAIYDVRFLQQPGDPLPTPWLPASSARGFEWNGRLVYELAGGCAAGYRQGSLLGPASHEALIARGYAVATSTLNIGSNDCNDVRSAEALSMVKEHFIKTYGEPLHTIGWGESGGAMQLYLIAQNYPGLLDGIIPGHSFPDNVTSMLPFTDCPLLLHAFETATQNWSDVEKSAVTGYASWRVCSLMVGLFIKAADNCDPTIPTAVTYDPILRRNGARCDVYDNEIDVFGRDPKTAPVLRPLDNIGVQYGLTAFHDGKIDAEHFIALNELVGGYDVDGNIVSARTEAPPEAIRRAYESGLVMGGKGLETVPIIDWRSYSDDVGDGHDALRSFVIRARLIAQNGEAGNQVILIEPRADFADAINSYMTGADPNTSIYAHRERELVGLMDHWLDAIVADRASGSVGSKVARSRPAGLADACWTTAGEKISGPEIYSVSGKCSQLYPRHADPRIAASSPLTEDILKCQLKPVDPADYAHSLTPDQLARLKTVFPNGVCDYRKPGLGQGAPRGTWQRF